MLTISEANLSLFLIVATVFFFRLKVLKKYPRVNSGRSFAVYLAIVGSVGAAALYYLITVRQMTWTQIGFSWENLRPSLVWNTVILMASLWVFSKQTDKSRRIVSKNLKKTMVGYFFWGLMQQFLVLGVLFNLFCGWYGFGPAVLLTGFIFGAFHLGNWLLFGATAIAGLLFALVFGRYPNLFPPAITHAVLGSVYYYWFEGVDKWAEIFS